LLIDEASNNIKRLQTKFEKEKSEQEAEIERLKNIELKKANDLIEQKNKDITDSINYAKRIQLGILPQKEILESCFENYFVFFQPKDIVSGDFYWAVKSNDADTNEKLSIIAAVDCTGHGVPGAFMSMLGNTLLNQTIINPEVRSAADVLNYLNKKLPENLKSGEQELNIRDGMDMALCIFDFKNGKMQFAGANNHCVVMRNKEMIELKGDKQAISASNDLDKKNFNTTFFELKKNDCIYLYTDGFADQFGGERGKKYKYKRLNSLLLEICDLPVEKQKERLDFEFENWKGELEQVDDVCVIGIKI
jgi:serine phosphatase RsbU (regulator of sigma subunit)